MNLNEKVKSTIDGLSYAELLSHWRFAKTGDPWMTGETGDYWAQRMAELKNASPDEAVRISKQIGWGR